MGASAFESEPCKGSVATTSRVVVDAAGMVHGLSQLAKLPDPPKGPIGTILASLRFEQADQESTRKSALELLSKLNRPKKRVRESDSKVDRKWQCDFCPLSYVNNSSLTRHVLNKHPTKRKRLVETDVFECEECEYQCATQAALDRHLVTHATSAEATKSPKYKCVFCDNERTSIYNHYAVRHEIEYPEQILFDDGHVLVYSSINTDGGKAPWFLREKEKLARYTDVTCRLCEAETSFDSRETLTEHYTLDHMVEPQMLENLKRVFRAKKGVHLVDLPASQTPKRKQSDSKGTLKKQPGDLARNNAELSVVFRCEDCQEVYPTHALLDKHKIDKHTPKDKSKPTKYKCCFCNKDVVAIYKHYGNSHKIEYPEQILFENGNVLVRTDIHTNGGQAPWFIAQKDKAKNKYTSKVCRLCDTDFSGTACSIERHYKIEHKVEEDVLKRLDSLRCLFRAEKRAHLADLPTSRPIKQQRRVSSHHASRSVNSESNCKSGSSVQNNQQAGEIEQDVAGLIMYHCLECGIAATTCDASIEHTQFHHFPGYKPIPQTCNRCEFSFEAQCFADHFLNHLDKDQYKIVHFDPSKLLNTWSEMFQGLSETHMDRIKSSSTYQHTRLVRMNSHMASGIPIYQCGKCELYVRPKEVEGHCFNRNCVENQSPGHFCSDCEIYFYTSVALTEHEKQHKQYGADCFRKVTFNCREDEPINRALQKLQNNASLLTEGLRVEALGTTAESSVRTDQRKSREGIEILENNVVSVFCDECQKSILYSEFEAHASIHKIDYNAKVNHSSHGEENQVAEQESQEQNSLDSEDRERQSSQEMLPRIVSVKSIINGGGTVELWNSDNDTCDSSDPVASVSVEVEVHAQKEAEDAISNDHEMTTVTDMTNAASVLVDDDMQNMPNTLVEAFDEFSEEMANDLKRDLQFLDRTAMAYIPDENLGTQDWLEEPKSEMGSPSKCQKEERESSEDDCGQDKNNNDEDKSMADATNNNATENNANYSDIIIEIVDDSDSDDEVEFVPEVENRESNCKMTSRAILGRMLSKEN